MPQRQVTPEELVEIERTIASKAPPGLSDDDFDRWFGPAYEQAIGVAEHTPAPLRGSALGRALSGVWEMVPSPKALYKALPLPEIVGGGGVVAGPMGLVAGMANEQLEEVQKAWDAPDWTQRLAHGAAAAIPVLGPMAAKVGEDIAETGDIAHGVGAGVALLAPLAYAAGRSANMARQARAGRPAILEREAAQQVADKVLAPGNVRFRGRAQEAARGILDRGMRGTRDELREAADVGMEAAGRRIDDSINAAGGPKSGVVVNPIIAALERKLNDLTIGGETMVGAESRVAELRARIDQLKRTSQTQPRGTVRPPNAPVQAQSFEQLRDLRDEMYSQAEHARAYERTGDPRLAAEGFAARQTGSAIRSEFARLSPNTAAANADFAFFKTLGDVLDPAQGRPKQTAPTSGVTGGSRTVGAVVGAAAQSPMLSLVLSTVLPWIEEIKARPEWQLASALDKARLAKAIRDGNIGRTRGLMAKISVAPRGAALDHARRATEIGDGDGERTRGLMANSRVARGADEDNR